MNLLVCYYTSNLSISSRTLHNMKVMCIKNRLQVSFYPSNIIHNRIEIFINQWVKMSTFKPHHQRVDVSCEHNKIGSPSKKTFPKTS